MPLQPDYLFELENYATAILSVGSQLQWYSLLNMMGRIIFADQENIASAEYAQPHKAAFAAECGCCLELTGAY